MHVLSFPGGTSGEEPACASGGLRNAGSIPGLGGSAGGGQGKPLQYSSRRIPWTEDPAARGPGVAQSRLKQLGMHTHTVHFW